MAVVTPLDLEGSDLSNLVRASREFLARTDHLAKRHQLKAVKYMREKFFALKLRHGYCHSVLGTFQSRWLLEIKKKKKQHEFQNNVIRTKNKKKQKTKTTT